VNKFAIFEGKEMSKEKKSYYKGKQHLYNQLDKLVRAMEECLLGKNKFDTASFPMIEHAKVVIQGRNKKKKEDQISDEKSLIDELRRIRHLKIYNVGGVDAACIHFNSLSALISENYDKLKAKYKSNTTSIYNVKNTVFWIVKVAYYKLVLDMDHV